MPMIRVILLTQGRSETTTTPTSRIGPELFNRARKGRFGYEFLVNSILLGHQRSSQQCALTFPYVQNSMAVTGRQLPGL